MLGCHPGLPHALAHSLHWVGYVPDDLPSVFAPIARRLGWRPEFPWARFADWQGSRPGVSLIERRPMPPMGHFSLIRYRKT